MNNLKPKDRPYILSQVFKIKLDQLMKDLKKKHIFERVIACMLITFQKTHEDYDNI